MFLAALAWLKLKGGAGQWLMQHTAPVRAKPDGRPCLEWVRYKIPDKLLTSYVSLLDPSRHAYTSRHLPIPILSLHLTIYFLHLSPVNAILTSHSYVHQYHAMQYVVHFQFRGLRMSFSHNGANGSESTTRVCFVQFAGWLAAPGAKLLILRRHTPLP